METPDTMARMIQENPPMEDANWVCEELREEVNKDFKYKNGVVVPSFTQAMDAVMIFIKRLPTQKDVMDYWQCEAEHHGTFNYFMDHKDETLCGERDKFFNKDRNRTEENFIEFKDRIKNVTRDECITAWRARVNVAYCSILREYHLFTMLVSLEKRYNFKVFYNRLCDQRGYDFIIQTSNDTYGIRSFVKTPLAYEQLQRKEKENPWKLPLDKEHTINLVIDPWDKSKQIKRFTLHTKEDLGTITGRILNGNKSIKTGNSPSGF